jgi:hypothetical protein
MRWKTSARDAGDPNAIWESLVRSQVPFSCLRTCQAWGPDDDLVAPERCQDGRECFELHPVVREGPKGPNVS